MFLWLKKLSGSVSDGRWFSARPTVGELELDRDWPHIERLIAHDGLPHTRPDVEGWLADAGAVALVAHKDDRFAGVFLAHPVGNVAHIDLVSVDPAFRRASIARPLYYQGVNALKVSGCTGFVAHARSAPGALLELLGYTPGPRFRLLEHEVGSVTVAGGHRGELLDGEDLPEEDAIALDAAVFGARREGWLTALMRRDDTECWGFRKNDALTALLVLQRHADGSVSVRLAGGNQFADISSLLHVVLVMSSGTHVRAWAREGSKLEAMLQAMDFDSTDSSMDFTEYRLGMTQGVGDCDGVIQLAWW